MIIQQIKVPEWKRREVEDIKYLINEYKVLAIINLEKLPAFNLMKIKKQIKGKLILKYAKKRLIKRAFDDENLAQLKDTLVGIPALIFTNEDPFKLFQLLKKNRTPVSAKAGDISPKDIIIPAGPTNFTPGPMIGELGALGLKTAVESGKIVIKADKLLVQKGEKITAKQAELMTKLGIEPMDTGINIVLTYQNGEILESNILNIDTDAIFENLKIAATNSISLAISINYITKETLDILIRKGQQEALILEKEYKKHKNTEPQNENIQNIKMETITNQKIEIPTSDIEIDEAKEDINAKTYDQSGISNKTVKKAQDILKDLTSKKLIKHNHGG